MEKSAAAGSAHAARGQVRTHEIAPGIERISSCNPVPGTGGPGSEGLHLGGARYLIKGSDATLLVDCGGVLGLEHQIQAAIDELLGGRELDWMFPTHLEGAHAGGLDWMADTYPKARIIADPHDYKLYFPDLMDRMTPAKIGDVVDLGGGYRFKFVKAILKDLATTLWGYEESQQVMFVADGFAFLHNPDPAGLSDDVAELLEDAPDSVHLSNECLKFFSEIPLPTATETGFLNNAAFWWAHHRRYSFFVDQIHGLLAEHPTKLIAPAHALVIDDVDTFLPILREGCDMSYNKGRQVNVTYGDVSYDEKGREVLSS